MKTVDYFSKNKDKVNFNKLFFEQDYIPISLLEKNPDIIIWDSEYFSKAFLPTSFLEKNLDRLNWSRISENENIPFSFLEKNEEKIKWDKLVKIHHPEIPESFFEKNFDKLDVYSLSYLSRNYNFSESFWESIIKKFPGKLILTYLVMNENIGEEFWEKCFNSLDCNAKNMLSYKRFSNFFWEKRIKEMKQLEIDRLCFNKNLDYFFWENKIDKITEFGLRNLTCNENLPVSFWWEQFYLGRIDHSFTGNLSTNSHITEDFWSAFIEKYYHNFSFYQKKEIYQNLNCSISFWEKNIPKIGYEDLDYLLVDNKHYDVTFIEHFEKFITNDTFSKICQRNDIPQLFFEKNLDKISWKNICSNSNMSVSFFRKNLNKINWPSLSLNPNIPLSFFDKYSRKIFFVSGISPKQRSLENKFEIYSKIFEDF